MIYFSYNPVLSGALTGLYNSISSWVNSRELWALVNTFDISPIETVDLETKIQKLLEISEIWDYRSKQKRAFDNTANEKMRWMVTSETITENQKKALSNAIRVLGLVGIDKPVGKSFDYIVILGGARLSCLLRTRLAYQLYKEFRGLKAIVSLSAFRPIADSEREATNTYAPNALSEFDLMNAAIESELGILEGYNETKHNDDNPNNSWAIREYRTKDEKLPIYSFAAPSSEPDVRRANSADTYKFFFRNIKVDPLSSLLLITSQIYVPYQQLEAIRTLAIPMKLSTETIGFPIEWNKELQGLNEPSNYLQEIRSTIQSIARLEGQYPCDK